MVAQADSIAFLIGFQNQYVDFPKKVCLDDIDPITELPFKEGIERAQEVLVPYYLLAVIQIKSESKAGQSKRVFRVYDGCGFKRHPGSRHNADPLTNLPIEHVHFFAIPCFTVQNGQNVKQFNLEGDIEASYLQLPQDKRVRNDFLRSLNYHKLFKLTAAQSDKITVENTENDLMNLVKIDLLTTIGIREAQDLMISKAENSKWLFSQKSLGSEESMKKIWNFCSKFLINDLDAFTEPDDDETSDSDDDAAAV